MGIIHVRFREGMDDDISAWYERQTDKSEYVRGLIQADMAQAHQDTDPISEAVTQALESLPGMVNAAVRGATGELRGMMEAVVRDSLARYQFTPRSQEPREDPELAKRLDSQLDAFFGDE